ncbi:zinc finger protein 106 isoform X2 [Anabas testudineus]|nr:zinc finger protein 106 isoform X2 [Anabas testudineus]XP_026196777.1 zinc finger protein 106 isoform X2 [Anabas testudineus]
MAKGETPQERVDKKPVKISNNTKSTKKTKRIYCILCRRFYMKYEAQEHMHGMLHHRELETVLGKDSVHKCQACKAPSMGLNEYAQHISTAQHKAKMKSLMSKHVKPLSLFKSLSKETINQILERNKTLKKEEKKAMKKKKKKLKQIAGQKRAETLQRTSRKNPVASRPVNMNAPMQTQDINRKCSNSVVVQNKENKEFSLQKTLHQRGTRFQNQSGEFHHLSGTPGGRSWHQPYVRDQFTQSTYNQHVSIKVEKSQTDRVIKRPYKTERDPTNAPAQRSAISQKDYYNMQYDSRSDKDFTSDHLPQDGAIIFDHDQNESTGSSQPAEETSQVSANPDSANKSINAAPIRDVDVSAMLRQIRRALGVREPCRADREARRQNSMAGVQVPGTGKEPPAGASYVHSPPVSSPATEAHPALTASNTAPANIKQTMFRMTEETPHRCQESSVLTDGPSTSKETRGVLDTPSSLSQSLGRAMSSEPNLNISRKVRIAHEPGRAQGGKETRLGPTPNKLLSLSGDKNRLSWCETHEGMKRKKQDSGKGMPRFGIELSNPLTDREISTQPQPRDSDLPLSEGFHWESFPDAPSGQCPTPPFPPQHPANPGPHTETHLGSQQQEPLEQPGTAQMDRNFVKVTAASVKLEPNLEIDNGGNSGTNKRKHNTLTDAGISDNEPVGKKKKTKSNKDLGQMDQLLAVSLREDELSHSLQDLDKSLVQARNALQAAYAEVQRLLLLRQQFIAEVNSLRTKRIEILQGMQEGYSGTSNVAEKVTTLSRLSPLPSSVANPRPPATALASPCINQPHPASLAVSIKQDFCHSPTAGQTSQFANAVLSNTDAPQVPLNQPVPFFPSNLLPSLLLRPSHLPALTTSAASTSVNTPPSSDSPARQQEQETRERLKDSGKKVRSAIGEAQTDEIDSNEETDGHGNHGKEQAAEKFVPRRDKNASAAAPHSDDGNESDDSVEMMEPSNPVVIDIDESDNEYLHDTVSSVPVHSEPPQTCVSVEFSSASTQTSLQSANDRKVQLSAVPVKDTSNIAESVDDEEPSLGTFANHTGPVHGLQVHDGLLYTCSGDNTARAYSLVTRECKAVFEGHTNKVNCLLVSSLPNMPARLYTGSSDQTIRCYSIKSKKCLEQLTLSDRVLCLHIAWNVLYAGLANGSVASHDLKTLKQLDVFECHGPRGVSCLATAQEGARRVLLVGSYDSTISVRDAKSGLLLRSLEGHTKTVLCMKVVNDLVFSGSSDTSVHAHNIHTGELVRIYKGHDHAVTSIVILGKVMVTACLDKLVRVYELQSHDRLQVYGGHSDMVMCMAVHKSVIYTGCYDGSVQAVKLNLMKNYRCWWQNCSLIFGIAEHLVQHLVGDHSNPNLQTVRCRWRGCNSFFPTQQSVRQELPEHMQNHAESDSKVQP